VTDSVSICPNCRCEIHFPINDANVFECPECVAELTWDGQNIIGMVTDRQFNLMTEEQRINRRFSTAPYYDSHLLPHAVDFANSILDGGNKKEQIFGDLSRQMNTQNTLLESEKQLRFNRGVSVVVFVAISIVSVLILMDGSLFGLCCFIPGLWILKVAFTPPEDSYEGLLQLASEVGGSFEAGTVKGFSREPTFFTQFRWKHTNVEFSIIKEILDTDFILAKEGYSSGGEHSDSRKWFDLYLVSKDFETSLETLTTSVHKFSEESILDDLNILASYQNQLLMHTGRRIPLRVQYSFKSDLTLKQKKQGKNLLVESEEIKALMKLLGRGE